MERAWIGITLGDPAGIGPEIVVKALMDGDLYGICRPLVFGDRAVLEGALDLVGYGCRIHAVEDPMEGEYEAGTVDIVECGVIDGPIQPGVLQAEAGVAAYAYVSRAVDWALEGRVVGMCTAPINKEALRMAEVPYLDHTAMLGAQVGTEEMMTLFVVGGLRIFFLTRHISFREVPDRITAEGIVHALRRCDRYLRPLGIPHPRIAVAALNPHGGEGGLFGREEVTIIAPGVEEARRSGLQVFGPVPADAVFHQAKEGRYDGVLSLYHDQGHIAAKTLDFHRTVSLTMGLPFLRTSVDHGTAFDIAGKGIADAVGMKEAIRMAARYAWPVRQYVVG